VRSRSVLAALVCSFLLGLSPLAAAPMIERGIDIFATPADGRTSYDFALSPIPAGFFCKGSKPFTSRIAFKGLPLATEVPGQLGTADTVVERLDDAVFNAKGIATTRIQFRALSLVSIAPIKTACGSFHAYVSLGDKQRVTTMRIRQTKENGGSFAAPLAANVRLTFIPVNPAGRKGARKLELNGSFTFPAISLPWSLAAGTRSLDAVVVDTNGDLAPDTRLPGASSFLPGLTRTKAEFGNCCSYQVCHDDPSTGKMHCAWTIPPGCSYAQLCVDTIE